MFAGCFEVVTHRELQHPLPVGRAALTLAGGGPAVSGGSEGWRCSLVTLLYQESLQLGAWRLSCSL